MQQGIVIDECDGAILTSSAQGRAQLPASCSGAIDQHAFCRYVQTKYFARGNTRDTDVKRGDREVDDKDFSRQGRLEYAVVDGNESRCRERDTGDDQ